MSQAGQTDVVGGTPSIPTQFDGNTGAAVPVANILNIVGSNGITTVASGNTVNVELTNSGPFVTSVTGTANRITSTGGTTPQIDISAAYVGQSSIITLGTITTGVWNGSLISPTFGGTGVNNGSNTLTLAGSLATSGAFSSTFVMTGATNVTFPTTGTLSTTTGTVTAVSVATSNGFAGTSSGGATPALTLTTSQTGILSGNGTAITGTAITQHGVLVAGASNIVNTIAPGTSGNVLTSNGSDWTSTAASGGISKITRQVFTSGTATYSPTSGTKFCDCEVLGGGGGGGGAIGTSTMVSVGGTGGAGGYAKKVFPVASVTGLTVTVGAGGTGGVAGNNAGATGGSSSIGSVITATGGIGGTGGAASAQQTFTLGGLGGLGTLGDFNCNGSPGGSSAQGAANLQVSGLGASSLYGGGALQASAGTTSFQAGKNATNYGSSGSGGAVNADATGAAGGNGSGGIVIITEYQ